MEYMIGKLGHKYSSTKCKDILMKKSTTGTKGSKGGKGSKGC